MNRVIILLAILACLSNSMIGNLSVAFSQIESEKDKTPIVDTLANTVVFIVGAQAGTAFIIEHHERSYIVTAKHLVNGALEVNIYANHQDGSVARFPISKIEEKLQGAIWIMHPTADLAIHPFSKSGLPGAKWSYIYGKTLYEGKAHLLDRLIAIGFPHMVGSESREILSPVVKETSLVSWPAFHRFVSESNLLVDPYLYPGFSGAPIYSLDEIPGESLFRSKFATLIGVYVGNLTVDGKDYLGRVIPAQTLIELLNSEKVKEFERTYKPSEPDHVLQDNSSLPDNH